MSLSKLKINHYNLENKEQIRDYWYKLLEGRINLLWIKQNYPFDWKRVKFLEESYFANWRYFIEEDFIAIDIASWFDIKTIVHELTHAFSSWKRNNQSSNNYEAFSKSFILNEWTTDLIALDILNNDKNIVKIWNYTQEIKDELILIIRNETTGKIKKIRKVGYDNINQLKNNKDEFLKDLNLSTIEIYKKMMKNNLDYTLSNHKHDEYRLRNGTKHESWYKQYVELVKNILNDFCIFYNKSLEEIFKEWQENYFEWNYNKIIYKLKEVYGDFDESILEWMSDKEFIEIENFFRNKNYKLKI